YAMKVILTQEVKGKGGEGDVIDVARGYAVNYLFARKMAIEATSGNLKQLEQRMHNVRNREATRLNGAASIASGLEGKVVRIEAKVGEEGRLYGSITSQMIEDAIAQQYELVVDRKQMDVHGTIKETGLHPVQVHVYREVKATIMVNVVAEGAPVVPDVVEEVVEAEETMVDEVVEVEADAEADEADVEEVEQNPEAE
ncbi:MAG: 50S ribosomal protein L9, partial [Actinomycetota bacterium]|nr:50S ribosomal protein L9 [Actinomycetota bacterium]